MIKKIIIILFLFISIYSFSIDHTLGFSFQGQYHLFSNFNVSAGLNYEVYFTNFFSLENIIFLGFTYDHIVTMRDTYYRYDGGSFIFYLTPYFLFGWKRVKFFIALPGFKFYMTIGRAIFTEKIYKTKDNYRQIEYKHKYELDYSISPGFTIFKFGLNIYFGKNYNIILTPAYIYLDYFFVSITPTYLYYGFLNRAVLQVGAGTSLKFKIGSHSLKKNRNNN